MNSGRNGDAVRLDGVRKEYGKGVVALDGVTLTFPRGGFTAVMGPSGSGKSTFLHCAAGLDRPTSGSVVLDGQELAGMSETKLTKLRRDRIGFIFQAFNLLPALTVEQNVTLPQQLAGAKPDRRVVEEMLTRVGLGGRRKHLPGELSGGQAQRVAIARALVGEPGLLLADEPTGALDTASGEVVLGLIHELNASGTTICVITHDTEIAARLPRRVGLRDGGIVFDTRAAVTAP